MFVEHPESIDCVLLDLSMPRRSGDEVHQELRAIRDDVPIIMMSGFDERVILNRFAGVVLTQTLQKPIAAADLFAAVLAATA